MNDKSLVVFLFGLWLLVFASYYDQVQSRQDEIGWLLPPRALGQTLKSNVSIYRPKTYSKITTTRLDVRESKEPKRSLRAYYRTKRYDHDDDNNKAITGRY